MFRRALSAFGLSGQAMLLSEREFASRLLTRIVEIHPTVPIAVTGDLSFTLNPGHEREYRIDLTQHYSLYLMEPERLDVLADLHTATISEAMTLAEVEPTIDLVVPLVWSQADVKAAGDDIVCEPLTNQLTIVYAFNLPLKPRPLTMAALQKLGFDRDALKARAIENAALHMPAANVDVDDGVALITCSAVSPSSLLLVSDFWRQGPLADIASIAVILPDRDHVVAFDQDNQKAILDAGQIATELMSQAKHPMSKDVILIKVDVSSPQPAPAKPPQRATFG
jgi:hypothetical protein